MALHRTAQVDRYGEVTFRPLTLNQFRRIQRGSHGDTGRGVVQTLLRALVSPAVADLEAIVETEGVMVAGSKDQPVLHPAVAEARQGRLAIDRMLGKIVLPSPEKAELGSGRSDVARRKRQESIPADRASFHADRINLRLRVARWSVEPGKGALERERQRANDYADPAERLRKLAGLADRVRPPCSRKAQRWTLPAHITEIPTAGQGKAKQ